MRISTDQFHSQSFNSIEKHQNDILEIQEKLSTGKRVNKPGDDPVAMTQIHALNKSLNVITQYEKNGQFAKSQLELEETQMTSAVELTQRVREISLRMMNDTHSETDRNAASQEVGQLIKQLESIMNSGNSEGELLFAGNNVNATAAFVADNNNADYFAYIGSPTSDDGTPTTPYDPRANSGSRFVQIGFDSDNRLAPDDQGDPSRVRITDNGGRMFAVPNATTNYTGGVEGGPALPNQPDANLLNVMVELRKYLENGDAPPASIGDDLHEGIQEMSRNIAEIGSRQNRIQSQYDAGRSFSLALTERKMNIEEMDVVQGISELTQRQTALQMAQQVFTRVQSMTLFDYFR